MVRSRFESVGMYAPDLVVSTEELIGQMEHKPPFDVEGLTGIKNRRHRRPDEDTFTISLRAMEECLRNSRYKAKDLDIIITCSISKFDTAGNMIWEPSISLMLIDAIGATHAKFFTISNACAGMGTGVHILNNMIKAGMVKNGMVISGECITHISDTAVVEISQPFDEQFGSLTVGDAGAAVILDVAESGEDNAIDFSHFVTMSQFSDLCIGMPSNETGGGAMYADSIGIHRESIERMGQFAKSVFVRKENKGEWDTSIDWVVPHQTSTKAMKSGCKTVRNYLGLDDDYVNRILVSKYIAEYGNTASTSHFVVLYQALKDGLFKKGDKIFLLVLASGIVFGSIIFTVGDLKINQQVEEVKQAWAS